MNEAQAPACSTCAWWDWREGFCWSEGDYTDPDGYCDFYREIEAPAILQDALGRAWPILDADGEARLIIAQTGERVLSKADKVE